MEHKKELFKEKVAAGSRTYFFDVYEASNGAKYLIIDESKKVGDKFEHNRIMIFEDQFTAFTEGFKKAYLFLHPKKATDES